MKKSFLRYELDRVPREYSKTVKSHGKPRMFRDDAGHRGRGEGHDDVEKEHARRAREKVAICKCNERERI